MKPCAATMRQLNSFHRLQMHTQLGALRREWVGLEMPRLVKLGKFKESIACFEAALRINPETANANEYMERAKLMVASAQANEQ